MPQPLSDAERKLIHDLALNARALLMREARELLEGVYGVYASGKADPVAKLPQVQANAEMAETHSRLLRFLDDEVAAGLKRPDAVEKLAKEVAFTHLNRLVAFKMMEARQLIRGTLDKGAKSNAFLFYLADPAHADDYARQQQGDSDTAYRHFLLWQAGQVAQDLRVLFDPDTLPSRLFPRPRALNALIDLLNAPELAPSWQADETVGWVYQYFNEPELQAAFEAVRTSSAKFESKDIASATQLFTPAWIVRYLVQNTLGRLWVQMHPDTALLGSELLDYLVPLQGEQPAEPLRPVRDITLLDPACGTMHFGLVAFDLFAAMYREELARAGEPGWPATPSVAGEADIAAAIIEHNLYGIDIDLRAVQLSALALYLKAKALNKRARISDNNLACADVLPLNGKRLGTFLREARFSRPIYERVIRALWEKLKDVDQLGSLLRLEKTIGDLIEDERRKLRQAPLFAGIAGEFEREALQDDFWDYLDAQIVQGLDEFARQQAAAGTDQRFFTGEAVKGLRLLNVMLDRYDVVVTNPPYMNRGKMNAELADLVEKAFPEGKHDLFAAFIQRCLELATDRGRVGMLTMHSFMFISSYESLRNAIRDQAAVTTMAHCGPALFEVGNPGTLQTTAFTLQKAASRQTADAQMGSYVRLVKPSSGDGKRQAFEQALQDGSNTYHVAQRRFGAIPGNPWVYWVSESIRRLFEESTLLESIATPRQGLATAYNFRFIRYWWEILNGALVTSANKQGDAESGKKWFPHTKGGGSRWYTSTQGCINWQHNGRALKTHIIERYPYLDGKWEWVIKNSEYYFRSGLAYTAVSSGRLSFRIQPEGHLFDSASDCVFVEQANWDPVTLMGILNSSFVAFLAGLNETINVNIGDLNRLPLPGIESVQQVNTLLLKYVVESVHAQIADGLSMESCNVFTMPVMPNVAQPFNARIAGVLGASQRKVDELVFDLYGLAESDVNLVNEYVSRWDISEPGQIDALQSEYDRSDLGIKWLSYALGIVLGRFHPGTPNALGSAIYHPPQFAIGSLPAPSAEEFNELVGPPEQFAYVDADGGRHVFSRAVEQALRALALPDGIAVLDAGHPRDLPARVDRALELMLGRIQADAVIAAGANGDLRHFLERDYFVNYHVKQDWYRKRPVYWWLQSAKRSYGFVLFHEKIDAATLYVLQRDYLDAKRNGLRLEIEDLKARLATQTGRDAKQTQRRIDQAAKVLEEIDDFAKTMARIVQEGYEPQPNWIDDGVILRMAPLWELIPIWKAEPQQYWERLQAGEYDWSHIAMHYWPERVREACRSNKSFAIAHDHESWYEGG